jgi:hypothetical protein
MVHALGHCIFNLNPRAPSIDTCLHGYVPYARMSTMCIPMPSSPLPPAPIQRS